MADLEDEDKWEVEEVKDQAVIKSQIHYPVTKEWLNWLITVGSGEGMIELISKRPAAAP